MGTGIVRKSFHKLKMIFALIVCFDQSDKISFLNIASEKKMVKNLGIIVE